MKKTLFSATLISLLISACSDEPTPYNAEQKNQKASLLKTDEREKFVSEFFSKLPATSKNSYWFRNSYQPSENLALKISDNYETYDIGKEPKLGFDISSTPVIADGKIFTIGGGGEVQAREINNPDEILWEFVLDKKYNTSHKKHGTWRKFTSLYMDSDEFLGGSISYGLGAIYGASRRGEVTALDAKTGKLIWNKNVGSPIRSAPVSRDGKVFVTTLNNKTFALSSNSGEILWQHEGLAGRTNISGSPAPLVQDSKVIVTYSSGEIFALDVDSGSEVWSSLTSSSYGVSANPMISDIVNSPIARDGGILLVTSDGRMMLISGDDGATIWETRGIAVTAQPWIVDDSVFAITRFGDLVNVDFRTGRIVWRKPMADPDDIDSDDLMFTSPIMADGKIFSADNDGTLRSYSPKNGAVIDEYKVPDGVILPPIVAQGRMFIISNQSKLVVME